MNINEIKKIIETAIDSDVVSKNDLIDYINSLSKTNVFDDPILEYIIDEEEGITHLVCMDYALSFFDCMEDVNDDGVQEWNWNEEPNEYLLITDDRKFNNNDHKNYKNKVNELFKKYDIKFEAKYIEVEDSYPDATTAFVISLKEL